MIGVEIFMSVHAHAVVNGNKTSTYSSFGTTMCADMSAILDTMLSGNLHEFFSIRIYHRRIK